MPIELTDYYERPSDGVERVLVRAGRPFQSSEVNELQAVAAGRARRLADALYRDGAVIRGCEVTIDADTGATTLGAGAAYVRGDIRGVPPATTTIPVVGVVELGVYLTESVVTDLEDPTLLNAVPGETFGAPGAARLRLSLAWGWRSGGGGDGQPGAFYRVYGVTNGTLDTIAPPPQLDGVALALARYDRDQTGGTYGVSGLRVTALSIAAGQQLFSLSEGRGHCGGHEVEKVTATRLAFPVDPDLYGVDAEPHVFTPVGDGSMRINVIYAPLVSVGEVKLTAEKTVTLVHGAFAGAVDALPDVSVVQIVKVQQAATIYAEGADYARAGNSVSWAPAGAEPAPGSSYSVTYRYVRDAVVTGQDADGFRLSGAVPGSVVYVDYVHALPRIDRLTLDRDGAVARIRGVSDLYGPGVPAVPAGQLLLCSLRQDWRGLPAVVEDGPRIMHVADHLSLAARVDALFDLVAVERLKTDARASEPAGAKGVFVDPLADNDMRDAGIAQAAAVVAGELLLPIAPLIGDTAVDRQELLTYTLEAVVEQLLTTGRIKVNPYSSFEPIPPTVTVEPPIDRWTETAEAWDTDSVKLVRTGHFVEGVSVVGSTTTIIDAIETLRQDTRAAEYLRPIPLTVTVTGLGAGEILDSVTFDGLTVGAGLVANAAGVVVHSFVIPAGIPAGTKRIDVAARATGRATTTFTGAGTIATTVRRRVATVEEYHIDPVAQSFALDAGRHVGGVELLFRAKGTSTIVVQLRDMVFGFPGTTVLAEARLPPAAIRTDGQPTRFDWAPVWIPPAVEHAIVVLCDDADAELATAAVGGFDAGRQAYVGQQPYRIGVMFSSSNATSWTVHQAEDLYFRILAARFTATSRTVPVGTLNADQVSDLIALFNVERVHSATRATLRLTDSQGRTYSLAEGQPLALAARLTGSVSVALVLEGTDLHSPVLFPGVQTIFGRLSETATYVSREFATPGATRVRVILDLIRPGTASVGVELQGAGGAWIAVPQTGGQPVGDGWEEAVFVLNGFTASTTRLRITLGGTALYRPRVRRIRAIAA